MAIETFTWRIQAASQPTTGSRDAVRKVQFGDGYTQISGSGLNDEVLTMSFHIQETRIQRWRSTRFYAGIKRSPLFLRPLTRIKICGGLRLTASGRWSKTKRL